MSFAGPFEAVRPLADFLFDEATFGSAGLYPGAPNSLDARIGSRAYTVRVAHPQEEPRRRVDILTPNQMRSELVALGKRIEQAKAIRLQMNTPRGLED